MISKLSFIAGYLRYYIKAKNRHDLHSPFLFNLYENVFRKDTVSLIYKKIEELRRQGLKNKFFIDVTDFGAGVSGVNLRKRKVSDIYRYSAKPRRYTRMLNRLVQHLKPSVILELGTSAGISTLYLAAEKNTQVHTIEGCKNTADLAKDNFKHFPECNITLYTGTFEDLLPALLNDLKKVDMIFIDGNHREEAVITYFEQCLPFLNTEGVVIIDDINWSKDMQTAWQHMKNHHQVTVTVDLYMMGLVFFAKDLSPQHISLRY